MYHKFFLIIISLLFLANFVIAGPGIKWESESILISEGEGGCLSYKVYNPWPDDNTVSVSLSEEISGLVKTQDKDNIFVPAETSSKEAIPVEFCFKVGNVYEKDCWLGGFVCEQRCEQDMIVYEGEVIVSGVSEGNGGGSATKASVSAPIRVRVKCNTSDRNYTLVYALLVLIVLIVFYFYFKRRRLNGKKKRVKGVKR